MCGIAGVAATTPWHRQDDLVAMRDALAHRGPDDAGAWWSDDGRVGLANRRLAIMDPSPRGHQPIVDAEARLALTFNGEIYNFRGLRGELEALGVGFVSGTDTEVLLEAYRIWGPACVRRLRGMFAFALYDGAQGSVLLARDRAGEKPLFYRHGDGVLRFGSELKALLVLPDAPRTGDLEALDFYLTYGYVPDSLCLVRGYKKLPPAHTMTFDVRTGAVDVTRYWSLPEPYAGRHAAPAELEAELEDLLGASVAEQLVADVPLGIMLSGGVDSSLVTALAARSSTGAVKTFTVSFPGHGSYDEAPHARRVADYFSTDHTEIVADPASLDVLPELARQFDEPIADSSLIPTYLVSREIRRHAKVALGGDGGDELFGGYLHYTRLIRQHRLRRLIPPPARSLIRSAAAARLPTGLKGRNYLLGLTAPLGESLTNLNIVFDARDRLRLGPSGNGVAAPERYKAALWQETQLLDRATRVDFSTYLPDDILVKVDRASMLASLEVRAPWLDQRLVEFAFGRVPPSLRATGEQRKILSRRLARRLLPPGFDVDRKQGFSVPMSTWLSGEWGAFAEEVLLAADQPLFDRGVVRGLVEGQRAGRSNSQRLFALLMLELWRREYRIDGFA